MVGFNLYSKKAVIGIMIVLTLILSTLSYSFSALVDANKQVKQDITDFSRGTYDILLRPSGAQTQLEQELNLIEENYLGVGTGGISMSQWEEVKAHPQVEIAAPVAAVGLFRSRERSWTMEKDEEASMYYAVQYLTTDGVHTYTHHDDVFVYDFFHEETDVSISRYASTIDVWNAFMGGDMASFKFPDTYHQVVAIDPSEEEKLVGFDFKALTDKVYDYDSYEDGEFSLPIMSLSEASPPVSIKLTIDPLHNYSAEEWQEIKSKFIDGSSGYTEFKDPELYQAITEEYIFTQRYQQEEIYEIIPRETQSPFNQVLLFVDEDMNLLSGIGDNKFGGTINYFSQRIGYQLEPISYQMIDDTTLYVEQISEDKHYQAPIYRQMTEKEFFEVDEFNVPLNEEDIFEFYENGTFSIEENVDTLASAPLGIYGRAQPHLAADPSIKLHPSAIPGSFVTTPAHGLLSMEWAEKLKGETPIDAIRVKVAGITGYDDDAATLIRDLASEWEAAGFTVDIVAGASLQELTVQVEGIGDVIQSFTTLGAADTVRSSINALQIALTILYALVALTFVSFIFFNLLADRKADEQLLAKLGWSEKQIRQTRYKEWARMLGAPVMVVLGCFISLGFIREQWFLLSFSILFSLIILLLFFVAEWLQKRKTVQVKKRGETVTNQNIWFYRFSILASGIQLFLTTILSCFLPFFLLQNIERTTQTKLGTYIHGEIEGLFTLIIILLYALSLLTIYQSLIRLWKKREQEIRLFLYLGWGERAIKTYFLKEVLVWASFSTISGWIVSLLASTFLIEITAVSMLSGLGVVLLLILLTASFTIYTLHRLTTKGGTKHAYQAS
ncbi:hypothetical protein [Alkalicoccobacillus plakortidis]|uniref:FtsX-like permease family protein n=1 Tax=Alkalicoccobacillus plakortidis TaxID=444060 RepID=A0ABT0XIB7_9BACI|nr:hypothetical protein [Alkalicoccobacillus plakortidis]MCM2675641.1 hypothetical protein [Alkalicoccobacillus plakortidis]